MNNLKISSSPHIKCPRTTRGIMTDVLIALIPTTVAGTVIFGPRSIYVCIAAVVSCMLSEWLFCLITKRKNTVSDMSAAVTGLLLALNLPASTPIWQTVLGSVFAIIAVKCVFGGLGQNFANPAITARIFMLLAFNNIGKAVPLPAFWPDSVTGATPLVSLKGGEPVELLDLFIGNKGGAIGEVCAAAIIIGAVYLLAKRVIKPAAPLSFILTVFAASLILERGDFYLALAWILSGGLMLGAFFMATDYVTTPSTELGRLIFGVGAGLITVAIRFAGSYPEGVSFGILVMNILTPFIDKLTLRKPFGGDKR